ncbi:MAG: tetratricopeptide repeat protein [Desulfosarcinaceae bacterium]|nr:tetratricopeptide repeat protein [Desulfosarcinaceae bacterium]
MQRQWTATLLSFMLFLGFVGCGSPEEKARVFFQKGADFYEAGDYTRARLELKNAVQIQPKFTEAFYLLGMSDLKERNYRQAYTYFRKTIALDDQHVGAHTELARIYLGAKALDKAKAELQAALQSAPDHQEARVLAAAVALREERTEDAERTLAKLQQEGYADPQLYQLQAALFLNQKDPDKALQALNSGIEKHPASTALMLSLVNVQSRRQDGQGMETALRRLVELEPDQEGYRFYLAEFLWKQGRLGEADDILTSMTASGSEKAILAVSNFYVKTDRSAQAIELLTASVKEDPALADSRVLLSHLLLKQARSDEAQTLLTAYLQHQDTHEKPDVLKVKNALARIYVQTRQFDSAQETLTEVLSVNANDNEALLSQGRLGLMTGKVDEAVTALRNVVKAQPESAVGYALLADAHNMRGETELAVDSLQQGMRLLPENKALQLHLARTLWQQGRLEEAERQLRSLVDARPTDQRLKLAMGDLLIAKGQSTDAEAVYTEITAVAPQMAAAYIRLAQLHRREENHNGVIAVLRRGVEKNPESRLLLTGLVQAYIRKGDLDAAERVCRERIAQNAADAVSYDLLGQVAVARKDAAAAISAFTRAAQLQPEWPQPSNNLAFVYENEGQSEKAVQQFQQTLKENPKSAQAYLGLALLHERAKDYPAAIAVYEAALEALPSFWVAANNLAYLLAETDGSEAALTRAETLITRTAQMHTDKDYIQDTLGWVFYKKGEYEKAVGIFNRILEPGETHQEIIHYHLAKVLVAMDRDQEAVVQLRQALDSGQDFLGRDDAQATLAKLQDQG